MAVKPAAAGKWQSALAGQPASTGIVRVAIVGAGPIGLDAAACVLAAHPSLSVVLFERGESAAAAVREWGHVTLFSPNSLNVSGAMAFILARTGRAVPDMTACPTGREYVSQTLQPVAKGLAELYGSRFLLRTRVEVRHSSIHKKSA
ncbi:hypothetical protein T492DRAFT_982815 [Pavlovales sp. CCMP2436]|nr:hypothetical protein T492DRAFT_982815 [Pavlovales sp. CCMP2436]